MAKSFSRYLFFLIALSVVASPCLSPKASAHPTNIPEANIIAQNESLNDERLREAVLLNQQIIELNQQGKYQEAIPLAQKVLTIIKQVLGEKHPYTAEALNSLGLLYYQQGNYAEAEPLYQQALAIRQEVLEKNEPNIAISLNNLGLLYYAQGNPVKAESLYQQALVIYREGLGEKHPELATTLNNLALLYYSQGNYSKAEPLYQQALLIYREGLGEKHPNTAQALTNLAELYRAQGNYSKAEPLSQQALALTREVLGEKHPNTAQALMNLAYLYYSQGNYSKAEPLYQQALALIREVLGENHPYTATALNSLAELYSAQGNYGKAEPLYQQSLSITKVVFGERHPSTATALNNLAELYRTKGDYIKAEPLYQQALAITREVLGENHPATAIPLNNLALLYYAQGNYAKAEPLYQQSLALIKQAFGEKHPSTATALNNLAYLYYSQGNYNKAEPLYQQSLAIRKEVLGENHPETAVSLNNLALLYYAQGNYSKTEVLYQQALAITKKAFGEKHPNVATYLNNLAELYRNQGNYVQAEPLYLESLAIRKEVLGEKHPDTVASFNNLALLYYAQGNYPQAERLYQQALTITKEVLGDKHPSTAQILSNLAYLYYSERIYDRAEHLYLESLAIRKEVLGEKHPNTAESLNNLALLYYAQGNYGQAELMFRQALGIHQELLGGKHPSTATSFDNLALLYWAENKINLALDNFTQGTEIEEYNLATFLNEIGDESRKQAYIQTLSGSTSGTIALHLNSALNNPQAARLALTTILRRKGRVLDALSNIVAILRQNATPQNQALFNQLAEKKTQLVALSYGGLSEGGKSSASNPEVQGETKKRLITNLEQDIQQLETQLSQESVQFRITTQAITLDGVQQAIPQNTALVEYIVYSPIDPKTQEWGNPRYAAYILQPTGEPLGIDLGDAETIDKTIKAFRATLSDPSLSYTEQEIQENGQKLYQQVFKPLLPLLKNTTNLLIAPDSQLNLVPFAAIQDEQGKYLVENYSLTYLTSGRDLLKLKTQFQPKSGAIVVANPTYNLNPSQVGSATQANRGDSQRSADLSKIDWCCQPLSGTKLEAEAITPLLPHVQVYTGEKALAETVRQINAPQVLHLATHGFFLPDVETKTPEKPLLPSGKTPVIESENPLLRSGLALAGFNPAQHKMDGALTALDVSTLNLWGTKLVVLSACQTGLGDVRNGEGVYGLRRAFVLAGAESQLMSLWSVSDEGTKELMVAYYQRLIKGEGRSEALRQVQLQMLKSDQFSNPFFWAAFIPSGDWRSLDGGK